MKSNFSSPGFLWPLLALICIVIILYGLNKALKKTEWTRLKGQKIFSALLTWPIQFFLMFYLVRKVWWLCK